ncbi:MAG: 50S ribosomal protein L22 [Chloroflexota bacterium]|nr:MAG: 50S ribosomal protein L22 [Chloroflexota bacterium]
MEVRSTVRYLSISPQKLRLVCDKVRGLDAQEALVILKFMPQKGAQFVSKAVASALANAENNFDLDPTGMYVRTIYADGGPMQKRWKAGARGRYKPRKRRTSHLTVILAEREGK